MAQVPASQRNQARQLSTRRANPIERLQRDFDMLFNRMFGGLLPAEADFAPVRLWDFDVQENENEVVVRAEIPGFDTDELDVQFNHGLLTIKAEREQKEGEREEYRSFFRSVTLPPGVDHERIEASYRNGVLELHIPWGWEAQPKRIEIEQQSSAERQKSAEEGKNKERSSQSKPGGQKQKDGRNQQANQQEPVASRQSES